MVEEAAPSDHISSLYPLDAFDAAYMVFAALVAFVIVFGLSRIGRRKKDSIVPEPISPTPHDQLYDQLVRVLSTEVVPLRHWTVADHLVRTFYNQFSFEIKFDKENGRIKEFEIAHDKIWDHFVNPPCVKRSLVRARVKRINRLADELYFKVHKFRTEVALAAAVATVRKMTAPTT